MSTSPTQQYKLGHLPYQLIKLIECLLVTKCFLNYLFHNLFRQTSVSGFSLFSLDFFLIIKKTINSTVHFSALAQTISAGRIAEQTMRETCFQCVYGLMGGVLLCTKMRGHRDFKHFLLSFREKWGCAAVLAPIYFLNLNLKLGPMSFTSHLCFLPCKLSANAPHPLSGICLFLFPLANVHMSENPAFYRTYFLHLFLAFQVQLSVVFSYTDLILGASLSFCRFWELMTTVAIQQGI